LSKRCCAYRYVEGAPYRTLLTRGVTRRDAQGRPTELVGVALDIGDNVRLTEEAREAARRATEIETMAGIGCWTLDPVTGHAQWDAGLFALHGRDSAQGTPTYQAWVEEYVHPDDRPRLRTALSAAAHRERKAYDDHCRIVRGDGKQRFLKISGHYVERADGMVVCGTMADVTDKRSMSDALRMELARMRLASDSAALGVWECSLEGEPLYWNTQMYRLHGLDPRDARPLKRLCATAHPPVDLARLRRAIEDHAASGQPLEHELRTLWADGSEHWIAMRGRVMSAPGCRGQRVYGVSWDLTERKHVERELRDNQAALGALRAQHDDVAQASETLRAALTDLGHRLGGDAASVASQLLERVDHLLEAMRAGRATGPLAATVDLRPLTLLCIEGSAVNLMMMEQLVQLRPHVTLHSASNGQSGIELARRVRPDIVLVDRGLPDLEGIEVLQRLRALPALNGATCIMLSASALQSDVDRALAAGCYAYWTKPIDREVFLAGLDAVASTVRP
jgi:PAS domain S-box-containing protein